MPLAVGFLERPEADGFDEASGRWQVLSERKGTENGREEKKRITFRNQWQWRRLLWFAKWLQTDSQEKAYNSPPRAIQGRRNTRVIMYGVIEWQARYSDSSS